MSSVCQDLSGTISNLICGNVKWKVPHKNIHGLNLPHIVFSVYGLANRIRSVIKSLFGT